MLSVHFQKARAELMLTDLSLRRYHSQKCTGTSLYWRAQAFGTMVKWHFKNSFGEMTNSTALTRYLERFIKMNITK